MTTERRDEVRSHSIRLRIQSCISSRSGRRTLGGRRGTYPLTQECEVFLRVRSEIGFYVTEEGVHGYLIRGFCSREIFIWRVAWQQVGDIHRWEARNGVHLLLLLDAGFWGNLANLVD